MKRLLRVIVIVIVVLGAIPLLIIAGVAINHHYFLGLRQVLASPDGRSNAYLRLNTMTSGPDEYTVAIRTGLDPLRHTVFGADTDGGEVSMRWADASHLVISCTQCERLDVFEEKSQMSGISITREHH